MPLLLICSFKFRSAFATPTNMPSQPKKNVFLLWFFSTADRELWPMTLTYELDLDMVKISNHAKVSTTSHFDQKLPSEHGDTHTHTHQNDSITRPLKRSKILQCTNVSCGIFWQALWSPIVVVVVNTVVPRLSWLVIIITSCCLLATHGT